MTPERIDELLAPFLEKGSLSLFQLTQIATYTDLLLKWNGHMNLTSIRDPEDVIKRHFGESLFAAKNLFPAVVEQTAIDVGSGAGFPGLPLKIWNPALILTLVEANQRKSVFLREVIRALDLRATDVFAGRAEQLQQHADLVILRAVERFERVVHIAVNLVTPGGHLALLIGEGQVPAARTASSGFIWREPLPLPHAQRRCLLLGRLAQ